jgi:tetratricopeptide (TPR) repeat protein
MKRLFSLVAGVVLTSNLLFAQSVDQGKKFFYYERYQSAKENFEKVLAANPNNLDAAYWLGQTLIELKDSIAAKDLYSKTLQQNGSAPLIVVGMGQIELMEGKVNDARQRFDFALSLTKNKDINVINAVGLANVKARLGDANYAVEKLTAGTQLKDFKNPDTYIILGNAYRKLIDGGNAVTSFTKALTFDPRMAAAKHNIGKVYLTQNNKDYFLPAFEEATQLDPAYAPSYFELFYYWYFRDVNKAAGYLDKYVANSDQGPRVEYLKTDFLYASSKFEEAKQKAKGLINQYGDKVDPRMYRLIAYTSDTTGDLQGAKEAMLTFLAKADPAEVLPTDYEELANIYAKIPGSEADVFKSLQMAVDKDTLVENKVKYITRAAAMAKKMGNRKEEANWLGIAYSIKKNPSQTDLYNWGLSHYQAGNYVTADSIFCGLYQSKYPNEIFGYLWCARAKEGQDTTWASGIAEQPYQKLAEMAMTIDSTKYKRQAIDARFKLTVYYNDIKKDKQAAIAELDKILAMDPANADAARIRDILSKAPAPKQPAQPKPKTGGAAKTGASPPAASKKK